SIARESLDQPHHAARHSDGNDQDRACLHLLRGGHVYARVLPHVIAEDDRAGAQTVTGKSTLGAKLGSYPGRDSYTCAALHGMTVSEHNRDPGRIRESH